VASPKCPSSHTTGPNVHVNTRPLLKCTYLFISYFLHLTSSVPNIICFRLISYSLNTSVNLTLIKHIIQNLERAYTNLLVEAEVRNTNKVVEGRAWHTPRTPSWGYPCMSPRTLRPKRIHQIPTKSVSS
jgi:ABC-type oligopeptide transport system ATPase subunit